MSISLKDIKNNFFNPYLKFWIVFFGILILYFGIKIKNYYTKIDKITENLKKSEYLTAAVAINETNLISSKSLMEGACGRFDKRRSRNRFFAFDKNNFYEVTPVFGDSVSNLIILRMVENGPRFKNHAVMQFDKPLYKVNNRYYSPVTLNGFGKYSFKKGRLVGFRDAKFFLSYRGIQKNRNVEGLAVFDKNFLLQGIVKEKNINYENKRKQDKVLDNIDVQKTFLVNDVSIIKKYLDSNKIEYYTVSKNVDSEKLKDNIEDAILNVVCVNIRANRIGY